MNDLAASVGVISEQKGETTQPSFTTEKQRARRRTKALPAFPVHSVIRAREVNGSLKRDTINEASFAEPI